MADIRFLLHRETVPLADLRVAFSRARVPAIEEIRTAFAANRARVIDLASS